jgi:inner membrane protein
MDNVTHTLVGLIVGETLNAHSRADSRGLTPAVRRTALVAVSMVGSNAPDLDLLGSLGGAGSRNLDYVLWHRGYTHTWPGCLVLSLVLYTCAAAWLRARGRSPSGSDRLWLLGAALLSTFLHLAMDYLNSYGVHPFWPEDNHWRYGDAVFIVEPLYWAAAAPLFFSLRTAVARFLYGLAMLGVPALGLVTGLMTIVPSMLFAGATLLMMILGRSSGTIRAARISALAAVTVTATFVFAAHVSARQAESFARAAFPADRLVDHVLTPGPADPLCWDLWLLETDGDRYTARHAVLSLAPRIRPVDACRVGGPGPDTHTAPLVPSRATDTAAIHWIGEFSMSRAALREDVEGECAAAAFMLFARAPFIAQDPRVLGDLRFDRGRASRSFEIPLAASHPAGNSPAGGSSVAACGHTAPWIAPRADLIGADPIAGGRN